MFKARLMMTLILVPLVLAALFKLPNPYFAGLTVLLVGVMLSEWQQFITLTEVKSFWGKMLLLVVGSLLVMHLWRVFIYVDILFWVFAIYAVITYPTSQKHWDNNGLLVCNAWLLIGVFAGILVELQAKDFGQMQLLSVLLIVWSADIGAYLVGKRWGVHKMIPQVSPGKSWEGLFGGIGLALIVGGVETIWINPESNILWFVVVFLTALISVVGDLWMSVLKRRSQLKDTGHLIPGHGGILDRLDSLLASLPVFYGTYAYLFGMPS